MLVLHTSQKFHHKYVHLKFWKINVPFHTSNFIYEYNSFYFQSVIFPLLFIVMVFTSILLVILNFNDWSCFILIFYIYDLEYHIIYAIPFIFRFLVLIVTSRHPATVSLFFSQHNGVVSPSPSIVFFHIYSWFHYCSRVRPLLWIAAYIGIDFLSDRIIVIYHDFYPRTMTLFRRHHYWLLYFEVFLWFPLLDDFNQSLDSLITLKITLRRDQIIAIYHDWFLSEHNGVVSSLPLLIVIFWSFSVIPPHGWVRPLIWIVAYIGSNFLSDCIIAVYHNYFSPITMASFHRYCC